MFSRLIQCRTGHAHTGEYYKRFVPTQPTECQCRAAVQTRQRIKLECKTHQRHRHKLGYGRHTQWGRLTRNLKGKKKLITIIESLNAPTRSTTRRTNKN